MESCLLLTINSGQKYKKNIKKRGDRSELVTKWPLARGILGEEIEQATLPSLPQQTLPRCLWLCGVLTNSWGE